MIKKKNLYLFVGYLGVTLLVFQIYLTYQLSLFFPLSPLKNVWLPELIPILIWLIISIMGFKKFKWLRFFLLILSPWLIYLAIKMPPQFFQGTYLFKTTGVMGALVILLLILEILLLINREKN